MTHRAISLAALLLAASASAASAASAAPSSSDSFELFVFWSDDFVRTMHERDSADSFFDPKVGAKSFTGALEGPLRDATQPLYEASGGFDFGRDGHALLQHAFTAVGMPLEQIKHRITQGVNARAILDDIADDAARRRFREKTLTLTLDARIVDEGRMLYLRGYFTLTPGGRNQPSAIGTLHWFSTAVPGDSFASRLDAWSADGARRFRETVAAGIDGIGRLAALRVAATMPQAQVAQVRYGDHLARMVDAVEQDAGRVVYFLPPYVLVSEPRRAERDLPQVHGID